MSELLQLVCPSCNGLNRLPSDRLEQQPKCGKCKTALLTGAPIEVTDQNFSRFIAKHDLPVIVDFWAPWCGPCVQFAPVFSDVASTLKSQASFVKLDTEANPNTAGQFQIRSIPTLMIFHKGREVARMSGALPKMQFLQWLHQHLVSDS